MNIQIKQKHIPLIATIVVWFLLFLAASIRYPGFLSTGVIVNLFIDNSFLGILAVGMTFVILSGGIDLSVGAAIGCSSIIIAVMIRDWNIHPGLAILIMLGLGILYGLCVGCLVHFFKMPPFMVTLAGLFFCRGLGLVISEDSVSIRSDFYRQLFNIGVPIGEVNFPLVAIVFLTMVLIGVYLAQYTKFGRTTYAIGGNETSAELMGLEIGKTKILIYTFSGFCSALGGVVYSLYTYSGNGWAGRFMELDVIASVVIGGTLLTGGVGYVFGTLFGVLILGIIQTFITFEGTLSSWWTRIVIGILLFVFILLQRVITNVTSNRKTENVTFTTDQDEHVTSAV